MEAIPARTSVLVPDPMGCETAIIDPATLLAVPSKVPPRVIETYQREPSRFTLIVFIRPLTGRCWCPRT
ncbi:hypothetical protein GCM10022224_056080 [Nonomuraea antimicrobica]|uniref:Uncharacterized protein n=1 Tax=Nonomuraea antimicrobica TaxID=561173 RepID=A0ABP7CBZ6_9ACTN